VKDIPGTIVLTLPLGWSIGELSNMVVLWIVFQRDYKGFSREVLKAFFQIFSASLVMGFVAYEFLNIFDNVFNLTTTLGVFLQGFLSGTCGIGSGVLILYLLGNEELREVWSTLHKKIWKPAAII
jgi:hypothetical protein